MGSPSSGGDEDGRDTDRTCSPAPARPAPCRIVPLTEPLWTAGGRAAYQAGIDTGQASFARVAPEWSDFHRDKFPEHLLAAVDGDRCLGWACVAAAFARPVYAGVVEESLYVHPDASGRGVGEALLQTLIHRTEHAGIWTLEALIFPENSVSLRLHHRLGFRDVGLRERFGYMTHGPLAGTWRDVLLLERRSGIAGRDSASRDGE